MEHWPIYLDQNVFSALQPEKIERYTLLLRLRAMADKGAVLVYSMLHVEECRQSDRPEVFANILEELSAHLIEPVTGSEEIVLSPRRARELILAEREAEDDAMRILYSLLKVPHFALGWLDDVEVHELLEEMAGEVEAFWTSLEADMPSFSHDFLRAAKYEMVKTVQGMDLQTLRVESQQWQSKLRDSLPRSYAQLDEIPATEVVAYMLSSIPEWSRELTEEQFPPKFWTNINTRQEGNLAGLAFMLFQMGLVRDSRVRQKERKRREKHFLGQFRDCNHIELASRCKAFVTFDTNAARLAKAVYSHAGVATEVIHLSVRKED